MLLRQQVSDELDEHIDMTPMVDVVFQLMTFMLFSLHIGGNEAVQLPPSHQGVGVDENSATILTVLRPDAPGAEPRILLGNGGGRSVSLADAKNAAIDGLAHGKSKVILQADGKVPHGDVVGVIAELSNIDGVTVHIGVQSPDK